MKASEMEGTGMSKPLTPGMHLLIKGTLVIPAAGTTTASLAEGIWSFPLDDDVVERLAEVGFEALWTASDKPFVSWGSPLMNENEREHWRTAVEAIFAELMGER
jgi:hypothetical protein